MLSRGIFRMSRVMRMSPPGGRSQPRLGENVSKKVGESANEAKTAAPIAFPIASGASSEYIATRRDMYRLGIFARRFCKDSAFSEGIQRIKEKGPVTFTVGLCSLLVGAGDVTSQKLLEGKRRMSWQRTAARVTGTAVIYVAFYTPFYRWLSTMDMLLPPLLKPLSLPIKVGLDTLVVTPCVFLPYIYTWMGFFAQKRTVEESLSEWRKNVVRDTTASLGIYVPGQTFNFSFVPSSYRLSFMAGLDFLWGITFCYLTQFSDDEEVLPLTNRDLKEDWIEME